MNSQPPKPDENDITLRIKQELDNQAEQLNSDITNKLDTIRQKALLERNENRLSSIAWWNLRAAPAFAAGIAVIIAIGVTLNAPTTNDISDISSNKPLETDFDVVLTNEDFELLEEDLEFYLWLDVESGTG